MTATDETDTQLPLHSAGDDLRLAREKKGLSIEQVAAETRIPQRHLLVMEAGDFSALPARTYAIGFARTYAKAVGLDERVIAAKVREELGDALRPEHARAANFEPGDPARVPSRGLAWAMGLAAVLLLAGIFAFYRSIVAPGIGPAPLVPPQAPVEATGQAGGAGDSGAAAQAPAPGPAGSVTFTALEDGVWIKFYDADGRQLMQEQMTKGETYTVPAEAKGPMAWTGRPDAFAITIGGRSVPKLAEEDRVVRDVPVTAEALLARPPQAAGTNPPPA